MFRFILLFSLSTQVFASPSGADVIAACEESLASGFQGIKGMMCTWYVTPCDCTYAKDPATPRVCLPEGKETEELAREVIQGLKSRPELQTLSAELSANTILAKKYPCD